MVKYLSTLPQNDIRCMALDSNNNLVIGYSSGGIITFFNEQGFSDNNETQSFLKICTIKPNPVNDELTITRENEISGILIITNRLGQTVYRYDLQFGEREIRIPLTEVPPGDYYIRIIKSDGLLERQGFVKW